MEISKLPVAIFGGAPGTTKMYLMKEMKMINFNKSKSQLGYNNNYESQLFKIFESYDIVNLHHIFLYLIA